MADTVPRSAWHRVARDVSRAFERLLAPYRIRSVTRLGGGARVRGTPYVENLGRIVIGERFRLDAAPALSHLVTGPRGLVQIGDDVTIGPGAAIAAEAEIRIGDRVEFGASVMILDTDFHDTSDRDAPSSSAPVMIGAGARLGRGVVVLKGAQVGAGAIIEAGSVVQGAVPGGARVWGVPAREHRNAREGGMGVRGGEAGARVASVVAGTFGLTPPVPEGQDLADIPGWDSLSALRLLLALEEEFGVVLPEQTLQNTHNLVDLAHALEARLVE
jgi:acetyltransferase-like isoleucine patch superfamily enzyme/acyl carrier protein